MSFKRIYIDASVAHLPEAKKIQEHFTAEVQVINDTKSIFKTVSSEDDPVGYGKKILFLTQNRGAYLKKCPGTSCYTCCDYQILHIGTFCTMDCSYCILQAYFHPPVLQYFVNHEQLLEELHAAFETPEIARIGTGEFTDSLIWEQWTDLSKLLITEFSRQDTSILELKTKTTAIEKLLHYDHNRKTIISWSLNTPRIIKSEERKTTSLLARLKAAQKCEEKGYPLAFHFDPVVIYENCEAEYMEVIDRIFDYVSPDNIAYISIGTFRFIPDIYKIIQKRFPDSVIPYGEFIQGLDGKMRYFKPLRIKTYRKIIDHFRKKAPSVFLYFCMEDDEIWNKCMGFLPSQYGSLGKMLDQRVIDICSLNVPGSIGE